MKRLILTAVVSICMVGMAQAEMITFSFDDGSLWDGATDTPVGNYMTSKFGGTVIVDDTEADNDRWNGNSTLALMTDNGSAMDIWFDSVITGMDFDGFVDDAGFGSDFKARWYIGNSYVDQRVWNTGNNTPVNTAWIDFGTDVDHLYFSNNGSHDVLIDNLVVDKYVEAAPIPVPGAVLLGMLGLSAAGIKLRKHA